MLIQFVISSFLFINAVLGAPGVNPTASRGLNPRQAPVCEHQADPGNGQDKGYCVCSQGATTTSVAMASGPSPCPWTALPITSAAPPPPGQDTRTLTGVFKTTNGISVFQCTKAVASRSAEVSVTSCLQPVSVVSVMPHITVGADASSRAQVGELATVSGTVSPLYTSVSSFLNKVCPTPTPEGAATSCKGTDDDATVIHDIGHYETWGGSGGELVFLNDGTLTMDTVLSNYTTSQLRSGFIEYIATTFQQSGNNNTYCDIHQNVGNGNPFDVDQTRRVCSAPSFVEVNYYNWDWNPGGSAGFMEMQLRYSDPTKPTSGKYEGEAAAEACEDIAALGESVLAALVPELIPEDVEASSFLEATCATLNEER